MEMLLKSCGFGAILHHEIKCTWYACVGPIVKNEKEINYVRKKNAKLVKTY